MNSFKFSIKLFSLNSFKTKSIFWGAILLISAWSYYTDFYALLPAFGLAFLITIEVIAMFYVGYFVLSKNVKFPKLRFWAFVVCFTILRFLIVYFILQHGLPDWTVFHYPKRSVLFLFFTSATLIFLGYNYSIYEWGLAARREYKERLKRTDASIAHPISIKCEGKVVQLLPQEIICLQANGEYINYITTYGNYMSFQRMKVAATELNQYGFIRVHRSFIINPFHIKIKSSTRIEMKNDMEVPVSKTYRENIIL